MLLRIDVASSDPPHAQLTRQITAAIADGLIVAGERLPTVRQLAADLRIAPNTVARTYRDLETASLIRGAGRRGTVVSAPSLPADRQRRTDVAHRAREFVEAIRAAGLSERDAVDAVRTAWSDRS